MPGTNELLMGYLTKKQYEAAKELIQSNAEDLDLNEINKGNSFLMALLRTPNQQDPQFLLLVRAIIQSNKFTVAGQHINPTSSNAFSLAILTANIELIKILLSYAEKLNVIFCGTKLQYSIVNETIKSQQALLDEPDFAEKAQSKLTNLYEILKLVRDNTIRHAISTDNASILQALDAAGASPSHPLSDGTFPITLVRKGGEVSKWYEAKAASARASIAGTNSIFTMLEKENADAQEAACKAKTKIYADGTSNFANLARHMASA